MASSNWRRAGAARASWRDDTISGTISTRWPAALASTATTLPMRSPAALADDSSTATQSPIIIIVVVVDSISIVCMGYCV
jgi:hypothetical protein